MRRSSRIALKPEVNAVVNKFYAVDIFLNS